MRGCRVLALAAGGLLAAAAPLPRAGQSSAGPAPCAGRCSAAAAGAQPAGAAGTQPAGAGGAQPAGAAGARPAGAKVPPPVAFERFDDVDGDGTPEQIRIERDGGLAVVSGGSGKRIAWKPLLAGTGVESGEIQVARGAAVGGRVVILALARGAVTGRRPDGRGEALALEWRGGALQELWRGEIGPHGPDGESTIYMEAGRHGLIRYSGRAGVARCDGQPAHLYAEKFDFSGRVGRFRPVDEPPRIPADAPELVATRKPPAGVSAAATPLDFRVRAASSQESAAGPDDLVAPSEIEDGNPATAWVEGRSGFGRGEFVTARASLDRGLVRTIRLLPGHAASARTFAHYNRLKKVGLLVGRDHAYRVAFPQDPAAAGAPGEAYWIELPEPVAADCVSVVVVDVYFGKEAGGRAGRTAISELAVLTEMDLAPGGAAASLAAQVAAGGQDGEQAGRVLVRLGSAAESAILAEAQKPAAPPAALRRLRRVLAELPGGPQELARGLAASDLDPADAERFARALVAIGAPAVEPLGELLTDGKGTDSGRAQAAHALGGIADAAALHTLAGAAGRGSRELRRSVSQAIGGRPAGELDQVVALARGAAQAGEPREADLWRAVGLMLRATEQGETRARAAAALGQRLSDAHGYELRYRLLEAAGAAGDPELLAAVAAQLSVGGEAAVAAGQRGRSDWREAALAAAQATALRRVAVSALGRSRAPAAVHALARAARDPDPGVREMAAAALGELGQADGDAALGRQLAVDRWSRVRRAAAAALGATCRRPAPAAALQRAALRDADVNVRRAALSSLATCQAPGLVDFLLAVAGDRDAPVELRTHALRLIGGAGDRSAQRPLAALVTAELERAAQDESAIESAAAGTYALGELGDPAGLPVILRAAGTVASPEIQAAAASALGRLCLPAGLEALRRLAQNPQHQVSFPAGAALRRCRRSQPEAH